MSPEETLELSREIVSEGPSFGQLNPLAQEVIRLSAELEGAKDTALEALSLLAGDGKDIGALRNLRAEKAEAERDAALKALEETQKRANLSQMSYEECSEFAVDAVREAKAQGWREGKEAAAQFCEDNALLADTFGHGSRSMYAAEALRMAGAAIRALPDEPPQEGR